MKKLLGILVLGLLMSGCETMNGGPGKISYKDENGITLGFTDRLNLIADIEQGNYVNNGIAVRHCHSHGKSAFFFYEFYVTKIEEWGDYFCSKKYIANHPKSNAKLLWTNYTGNTLTTTEDISFTIKDKKEQCTAIGFEPATEKFADCVLRLVELDVKSQQATQIALAQSQGNQQVVDQLKKQRNDQSSQYFLDLGEKLLNPQSTVSAPSTSTCRVTGGVYKTVSCW